MNSNPQDNNITNIEIDSMLNKISLNLKDKLASIPASPGCYMMKNEQGKIIYVGKAKILRNRVKQYFRKNADHTRRTRRMVFEIEDIDWIVTDSELEALILENNLIKKYHPNYNVRLMDDKSYPYIAITLSEEWPRPIFMRKLRMKTKETDKYYGPYTDSLAVREMLKLIRKIFKVPCGYVNPEKSKGKACMYYHINQCLGPCANKISKEEYMSVIKDIMSFLEGSRDELANKIAFQMEESAENLEFEKAAKFRDQLQAIKRLTSPGKIMSATSKDLDVITLITDKYNSCVEMLFIRGGKLLGQEHFFLENAYEDEIAESLQEFILQYYENAPYIPKEIVLNADIEEVDALESWLSQKKTAKVVVCYPKRGEKKELIDLAKMNARLSLEQLKKKLDADEETIFYELNNLREAIDLPTLPKRIEAYDISNIQGYHTVASLVIFKNGKPASALYRRFKMRRGEGQPDDYASMREVVLRRLTGQLRKQAAFTELPDLMLIDGGKGQLNAALESINASGEKVFVIGLAKRNEEIFKPGLSDPIIIPRTSKVLKLLQRIRDEAHRFAITYHRSLRSKTIRASILNKIDGIGAKRKSALLRKFGSVERIKNATIEELTNTSCMNLSSAKKIYDFFLNSKQNEND